MLKISLMYKLEYTDGFMIDNREAPLVNCIYSKLIIGINVDEKKCCHIIQLLMS